MVIDYSKWNDLDSDSDSVEAVNVLHQQIIERYSIPSSDQDIVRKMCLDAENESQPVKEAFFKVVSLPWCKQSDM